MRAATLRAWREPLELGRVADPDCPRDGVVWVQEWCHRSIEHIGQDLAPGRRAGRAPAEHHPLRRRASRRLHDREQPGRVVGDAFEHGAHQLHPAGVEGQVDEGATHAVVGGRRRGEPIMTVFWTPGSRPGRRCRDATARSASPTRAMSGKRPAGSGARARARMGRSSSGRAAGRQARGSCRLISPRTSRSSRPRKTAPPAACTRVAAQANWSVAGVGARPFQSSGAM